MSDSITLSFFGRRVRKFEFLSCQDIFVNLSYRASERIVPALYQRNYYPYYYSLGRYFSPGSILEIGSRFGYSLIAMAQGAKAEGKVPRVLSIDLETYDHEFGSISSQEIAEFNFAACVGQSEQIEFKKGNSHMIDPESLGTFDLIHVDGDHSEEGSFKDITRYFQCLNEGGKRLKIDPVARLWEIGRISPCQTNDEKQAGRQIHHPASCARM